MLSRKWPDWMEDIWAKSPVGNEVKGESLAAHTWENLSRLLDLARLKPGLPQLCNYQSMWHVLFWATFLHDWGKIAHGFQDMLKGKGRWFHRHEVLSLVFIEWMAEALSEEETKAIIAAIVSHHKDPEELFELYPLRISGEDDPLLELINNISEEDLRYLWLWLNETTENWIKVLEFDLLGVRFPNQIPDMEQAINMVFQGGVDLIRKRLRSYRLFIRDVRDGANSSWILPGLMLRGCLLEADHVSSAHTGNLPEINIFEQTVLENIGIGVETLHKHQLDCLKTHGSTVLIAPTGSGKTESALFWVSQQLQSRKISRLFYTLPYQASMNAMYDRLCEMFPGQVGLLHSRSKLALYRRLMERDYDPSNALKEAKWMRNLAKLHYQPLQVFSPYQMLKAIYQLKGYETMLVDFAGSAFILDEIHAYEPERLALILEFVAFLRERLGACFFVMSATMPSITRSLIEEALGNPITIKASESLFRSFTRHISYLIEGEILCNEGIERIVRDFKKGKSVLVTCNSVFRAQEAYNKLKTYLPESSLVLIHGRFNGYDRLVKERHVITKTGLKSSGRQPIVVVSTQVVEVSLNIDLDVLYSDPAPLEALIQRFGRINRGRRKEKAPVYVFTEPVGGHIYNSNLVNQALHILNRYANGLAIDEGSVQNWLDEIYTNEIAEDWLRRYNKVAKEFREVFIENLLPFSSDETMAQAFERLFDGIEILPLSLQEEYEKLAKENPLEASQYIVPVTWGKWNQFKKTNLVRSNGWPPVVDVPYSSEYGLGYTGEFE